MGALPKNLISQMAAHWDTADNVEKGLFDMGFVPFPRPEHLVPAVTVELLTTLNDTEYTERYSQTQAWCDYARMHTVRTEIRVMQEKSNLKHLEAALKETKREQEGAAAVKFAAQLESEFISQQLKLQEATQSFKYMEEWTGILKARLALFSRQVTIRGQEREQMRLEQNLPMREYRGGGYERRKL